MPSPDRAKEIAELERIPGSGDFAEDAYLYEWAERIALDPDTRMDLRVRALKAHDRLVRTRIEPEAIRF